MRKLLWCCSAAGVLALGGMFSATYYGYCYPDSTVGRCITTAATASIAMQPVSSLASMMARASHLAMNPHETAAAVGGNEECIPEDPQPVAPEEIEPRIAQEAGNDFQAEGAPIVIHEDEPLPQDVEPQVPATVDITGLKNGPDGPDNVCPLVMPYCTDDDEQPAVKPVMPFAEEDEQKPAATEESEDKGFKEWMKLFEGSGQENKSSPAEVLPLPQEEPQSEPKCQEDVHLHEHYSGCPRTTCPYTGKSYPSCPPATKSGKEESSEEPPLPHRVKKHSLKEKSKDSCPHTEGVDTMEYRPSDGGLNEYGPGPL
jgi:hypothetical protein